MSFATEGSISQIARSTSRQPSLPPQAQLNGAPIDGQELPEPKWITEKGSQRWMYFQSALRLAIQRVSHKWTYEDFSLCFPLMCEEEPELAGIASDDIRRFMEKTMEHKCDEVFDKYALRERIDEMYAIVQEGRQRRQRGEAYTGHDAWRDDIAPHTATRARTVPVLEEERDRLRAVLANLEEKTETLQAQLRQNVKAKQEADDDAAKLLDTLDQVVAKWEELPGDSVDVPMP